jgi:hypothetical protein
MVADWDSGVAVAESPDAVVSTPFFDALCLGTIERSVFRRRSVFEPACRSSAIDCALVRCPAATRSLVQAVSEQVLDPVVSALPGFVMRHTYQDVDDTNHLLIIQGWDAPKDLERFLLEMAPRLTASLCRLGATIDRFAGQAEA